MHVSGIVLTQSIRQVNANVLMVVEFLDESQQIKILWKSQFIVITIYTPHNRSNQCNVNLFKNVM